MVANDNNPNGFTILPPSFGAADPALEQSHREKVEQLALDFGCMVDVDGSVIGAAYEAIAMISAGVGFLEAKFGAQGAYHYLIDVMADLTATIKREKEQAALSSERPPHDH